MVDNSKNTCLNCKLKIEEYKKFCSSSCSAKHNNKNRIKKNYGFCLECNKTLKRKGRKYCSNKCQGLYKNKNTFKQIESGNLNFHEDTFKRYLIQKYGEKCMSCQWCEKNKYTGIIPIQLEHIDGDSNNNILNNLKLLCPNCHSLTPTWGGANKGNGRKQRREKRQKEKMAQ